MTARPTGSTEPPPQDPPPRDPPADHVAAARSPQVQPVGAYRVLALVDAAGTFFLPASAAFPAATAADWARARRRDPGAFGPDGAWRLPFRCFAVRRPGGRTLLVDAGVGPQNSPAAAWAPVPGRLPAELAAAGVDPDDVDVVVLTHLHADHAGWSMDGTGRPMFRNARYVIQQDEIAALEAGGQEAMLEHVVRPLRATGQLDPVRGQVVLVDGQPGGGGACGGRITAVPTPGHTPGHQSVLVEDGHRQVVVTGDVLVHAVQLVAPEVAYRYEADEETARRTRRALLATAETRRAVLATAHLTEPFVAAGPFEPGSGPAAGSQSQIQGRSRSPSRDRPRAD